MNAAENGCHSYLQVLEMMRAAKRAQESAQSAFPRVLSDPYVRCSFRHRLSSGYRCYADLRSSSHLRKSQQGSLRNTVQNIAL